MSIARRNSPSRSAASLMADKIVSSSWFFIFVAPGVYRGYRGRRFVCLPREAKPCRLGETGH
ncbi:MAG: hypothetical protein ACTHK7_05235 [Aureliella sp.]